MDEHVEQRLTVADLVHAQALDAVVVNQRYAHRVQVTVSISVPAADVSLAAN